MDPIGMLAIAVILAAARLSIVPTYCSYEISGLSSIPEFFFSAIANHAARPGPQYHFRRSMTLL